MKRIYSILLSLLILSPVFADVRVMKFPTGRPANVVDVLSGEINVDTILSPTGTLTFGGTGATDEIWTANFRDVDNSILFSTTSGVIGTDWNADFYVGARFGEGNRVLPAAGANHGIWAWSDDITNNNDKIGIIHDQSDGLLTTFTGDLYLQSAGKEIVLADTSKTRLFTIKLSSGNTQSLIGVNSTVGNQLILVNDVNLISNYDHLTQTNLTRYIHSGTNPDIRNNEWGSEHHDKQNYVITSGSQIEVDGIGTKGTGVRQACVATNATNLFTDTGHILSNTERIMIGGVVPTGIDDEYIYYVVGDTTDTFQVSLTSGGAAVTFSDDGTNVIWSYASDNAIVFAPRGTEAVKVGGNGSMIYLPDSDTIADSGDGNPATATLNPTKSYVKITCNDSDTCDVTMGETGAVDGQTVRIVNVSANVVDFADTSGVTELNGAYAMGQWQTLILDYVDDRWVEYSRSAN